MTRILAQQAAEDGLANPLRSFANRLAVRRRNSTVSIIEEIIISVRLYLWAATLFEHFYSLTTGSKAFSSHQEVKTFLCVKKSRFQSNGRVLPLIVVALLFLFAGCRPAGVEDPQVLVYGPIVHASKFQKNSIDYDQVIQQKTVISIDNTRGSTSIQLTNLDLFYSIGMHKWTIRLKLKDKNVIISKNEGKVFLIERPLYRSIGRWPLGKSIDERMEKNMKADLKYIVVKGLAKFETTSGKSRFSVRTVESKVKELPETDRSLLSAIPFLVSLESHPNIVNTPRVLGRT